MSKYGSLEYGSKIMISHNFGNMYLTRPNSLFLGTILSKEHILKRHRTKGVLKVSEEKDQLPFK